MLRGNVNVSGMRWRTIRYRFAVADVPSGSIVKVELGGAVPFAEPPLSLGSGCRGCSDYSAATGTGAADRRASNA